MTTLKKYNCENHYDYLYKSICLVLLVSTGGLSFSEQKCSGLRESKREWGEGLGEEEGGETDVRM